MKATLLMIENSEHGETHLLPPPSDRRAVCRVIQCDRKMI